MSGYAPENQQLRPHWLFIRKPLDTNQLREMIRSELRARRG